MVAAAERARLFQRQNVGRLLDHAEQIRGARRVGANAAEFFHSEKAATRTGPDGFARGSDRARDRFRLVAPRLDDPERDPLRRARTDPRHLAKLRDQIPDRGGIFRLPQNRRKLTDREACSSIAGRAARAGADTIAAAGPLPPPARAHFGIASTLPPSVFPGKAPRRSRTRRAA